MFPLKTLPNARRTPYLTRFLVLLCVLAFGVQWILWTARGVDLAQIYGVVPRCSLLPSACGISLRGGAQDWWLPFLVSLFLHGGLLHLAFNMLFLSAFGGGLEDKIGRLRFLLVYFGGGIAASAAHILFHPLSMAPTIGASGAIAAVLGAYLVALPKAWVLTYFPPIFFFPVPAPLFLLIWSAGQITSAFGNWVSPTAQGSDIAWMAHLGGFAAGAFYGWRLRGRSKTRRAEKV